MSRIYNPPTTSTKKVTSSTARPTPSGNVFARANSVAVTTNKDAGKMTRQQSAAAAVPSGHDPLRLVKVDTNPLVDKAKQTLNLLEQQNEWKIERRKEIAEGVKDIPADQSDWESSLSKWKDRRQSVPTYQPKVLDMVVDKIDWDTIGITQNTPKKSNGRESLSKLHHQLMYDDDTNIQQSDSKTQQQQQSSQHHPRESHGIVDSYERQVSVGPSEGHQPTASVQRVTTSKTVTSSVQNVNNYGLHIVPDVRQRPIPFSSTSQVTAGNYVPKLDHTLTPVTHVTPVTSVTPTIGDRETTVIETRPVHLSEDNVNHNNNQYNNVTRNNDGRITIKDNEQLTSKQEEINSDSTRLADHGGILTETMHTNSVSLAITLQSSKENTDVTGQSDVITTNDITPSVDKCLAEKEDLLDGDRPAVNKRLTQLEPHHRTVDDNFRVTEDITRPEVLCPVNDLAITHQNGDLIDLTPSSLSTSPPPDSPPPLPSVPPPSLRWTMFPSTVNETTDFDYDAESPYGSPVETVQFGLKTVF